jgi:hypothetical protein
MLNHIIIHNKGIFNHAMNSHVTNNQDMNSQGAYNQDHSSFHLIMEIVEEEV